MRRGDALNVGIAPWPDWFTEKVTKNEITTHRIGEIGQGLSPFDHSKIYRTINTLEGVMIGNYGDFIIKDINDKYYLYRLDIFEKTYEPILGNDHNEQ